MTQKTIFIAEAGVNHNGKISLAKKNIDMYNKIKCLQVSLQI
mgnify:CR=1 FL=1